jgi:prevent-host-death family protein
MAKERRKGAEQARNELPSLLEDAARGKSTIITRRGRSIAALVPVSGLPRQRGLIELAGSGKGMWGAPNARRLRRLRDEWNR